MLDGPELIVSDFSSEVKAGLRLRGGWIVGEAIGRGGTATVYRASDERGAVSAVKIMHAELGRDGDWAHRWRREGELLRATSHPGLARLFDAGTLDGGLPYLVMELLDGASLDELRQQRGGVLPPELAVQHGAAVLEVLAHLHGLGVLHRDLKPSNVFVTTEGRVKVLDFGIASKGTLLADSIARSATRGILGTPAYMAPEQARGRWELVDTRTDLWAVGALLFTLLSGQPVHAAETENERLGFAMTRRARPLRSVVPSIDPALAAVVDRALAYDPERRFQSASDFRDQLLSAVSRGSVKAPRCAEPTLASAVHASALEVAPTLREAAPEPAVGPARRESKRHPARLAGFALVLAVAGVAGARAVLLAKPAEVAAGAAATQPTAPPKPASELAPQLEPPARSPASEPSLAPTNTPASTTPKRPVVGDARAARSARESVPRPKAETAEPPPASRAVPGASRDPDVTNVLDSRGSVHNDARSRDHLMGRRE